MCLFFEKENPDKTKDYRGIEKRMMKWSDKNSVINDARLGFNTDISTVYPFLRFRVKFLIIKNYVVVLQTIKRHLTVFVDIVPLKNV